MSFLDLPYDIRHTIYSHLFPRTRHLYLHATDDGPVYLSNIDCSVPVAFLRTCKSLNQEASEYLYNGYVFDVYGRKSHILANYKQVQKTVEKYARDRVHTRALSNGPLSITGCMSIVVGDAKLATLERRGRGQPTTIEELQEEERARQGIAQRFIALGSGARRRSRMFWWTLATAGAAVVLAFALIVGMILP